MTMSFISLCRRIFDDVWTQFAQLASPLGSRTDEDMDTAIMGTAAPTDFDTPEAPTTRVLVVGATGRYLHLTILL